MVLKITFTFQANFGRRRRLRRRRLRRRIPKNDVISGISLKSFCRPQAFVMRWCLVLFCIVMGLVIFRQGRGSQFFFHNDNQRKNDDPPPTG